MPVTETKTYSIKDFSAFFNLKPSTLRYYEKRNLINPQRLANGHRCYTEDDIGWMKFILHLKNTGMSIDELQQYVKWRRQGDKTISKRVTLLKNTQARYLKKIAEENHHLQILTDKISWYEKKQQGLVTADESFACYLKKLKHRI